MKPLRVGIIGTGWGQLLLESFRRVHDVRVVALCDADERKRSKLAQQYNIEKSCGDFRELIAADVDWVAIAAPPELHAEMAGAAIEAGKHVLSEKPLALTLSEAAALLAAAKAKGIVHGMDYEMRFLPAHAYVKELVDEDYVGKLLRVDVSMTMERPWGEHGNWAIEDARGGGVLTELGTHFLDSLRWWFGNISSVISERRTLFPSVRLTGKAEKENGKSLRQVVTGDDAFWCVLRFATGGEALVNFMTGARHDAGWTIGIYGQTGTLLIKSGQLWSMREGDRELGLLPIPKRLELETNPNDPLMWSMAKLIERQTAKINGVPESLPFPDFGDAVAVEKLVEAIRLASSERRWVSLEQN